MLTRTSFGIHVEDAYRIEVNHLKLKVWILVWKGNVCGPERLWMQRTRGTCVEQQTMRTGNAGYL